MCVRYYSIINVEQVRRTVQVGNRSRASETEAGRGPRDRLVTKWKNSQNLLAGAKAISNCADLRESAARPIFRTTLSRSNQMPWSSTVAMHRGE